MATYKQIEQSFLRTLYEIKTSPYVVRRTIAAWPHFECLRDIITDLNPIENKEDDLFLHYLNNKTSHYFYNLST